MNAVLPLRKALFFCAVIILGFSFASWQNGPITNSKTIADTTPKREKKIVNLDDALNDLDAAGADVEKTMREIDWDKMQSDLNASLKNLNVDMKTMQADLKKSLSEIDVAKIQADVKASVDKINWDEIRANIDEVKNIKLDDIKVNIEAAKAALEKQKPELEKNLREARESIAKAKVEIQEYKSFINNLQADGLIDAKKDYTIENKNGTLIINGTEQPQSVYNKYRTFLDKNKKLHIEKNGDGFNVKGNKD